MLCSCANSPSSPWAQGLSPHLAKEAAQCPTAAISPSNSVPGPCCGWAIEGMAQLKCRARLEMLEHLWPCKDASWSWKCGLLGRWAVSGTLSPGWVQVLLSFPFAIPVQAVFGAGITNWSLRTEGLVLPISGVFSGHKQMQLSPGIWAEKWGLGKERPEEKCGNLCGCLEAPAGAAPALNVSQPCSSP